MSDDKGQQEPSMEDILASIRRILSEDDIEEPPKPAAKAAPVKAAPPPPEPEPEPEPVEEEDEDVLELDDSMVLAEPEPEPEDEPEDDTLDLAQFVQGAREPEMEPEPEPEPEVESALESMFQAEVRPMFAADDSDQEPDPQDGLLAAPVAEASTAALTELARAVARERGIGLGARGVTLEDLVREILRPILKDWLDQNLPYMIERIVRKEIERMVNRAEKL